MRTVSLCAIKSYIFHLPRIKWCFFILNKNPVSHLNCSDVLTNCIQICESRVCKTPKIPHSRQCSHVCNSFYYCKDWVGTLSARKNVGHRSDRIKLILLRILELELQFRHPETSLERLQFDFCIFENCTSIGLQ